MCIYFNVSFICHFTTLAQVTRDISTVMEMLESCLVGGFSRMHSTGSSGSSSSSGSSGGSSGRGGGGSSGSSGNNSRSSSGSGRVSSYSLLRQLGLIARSNQIYQVCNVIYLLFSSHLITYLPLLSCYVPLTPHILMYTPLSLPLRRLLLLLLFS